MNKRVMYFLKKQVILIMVIKICFKLFLLLFVYHYSYSNVIYEKNDIVITEFDIEVYQKLYKQNYNSNINRSNSIKDLVLINKLISISALDGNIDGKEAYLISFLANTMGMNVSTVVTHMVNNLVSMNKIYRTRLKEWIINTVCLKVLLQMSKDNHPKEEYPLQML